MLFRKNIYKKEKERKVGHKMFYLSIPLNIAWTNPRIRRLLISVDTCLYTFTTISIVSPKKRIFCADKRKSRICGLQMNMVYRESDCYGLLIEENELDCAQAKNLFYLYWPELSQLNRYRLRKTFLGMQIRVIITFFNRQYPNHSPCA